MLIKIAERTVIYNSMSTAFLELSDNEAGSLCYLLCADPDSPLLDGEVQEDASTMLRSGGFLVPADLDEIALVDSILDRHRYGQATICAMVTDSCNLDCAYCGIGKSPAEGTHMSKSVIESIAAQYAVADSKLSKLIVTGGEPLLYPGLVIDLCDSCQRASSKSGKRIEATLITNATLLTPGISEKLAEAGVTRVQATVDGGPQFHNRRRPYRSGAGSFETIVSNVKSCSHLFERGVLVRVNIDSSDPEAYREVLSVFRGLPSVSVYVSPTRYGGIACEGTRSDRNWHLLHSSIELFRHSTYHDLTPRTGGCAAISPGSVVVSPDGTLFRCWHESDFRKEGGYGNICTGYTDPLSLVEWFSWTPTSVEECRNCPLLPLCMGGCPAERLLLGRKSCDESTKRGLRALIECSYMDLLAREREDHKSAPHALVPSERRPK